VGRLDGSAEAGSTSAAISISRRKRFGTERHGQLRPQHLHRDLDLRQVGPRPATSRSRASMRCRALCVEWCVDQCRHGSKSGGAHPGTSRGLSMICRTEVGLPTGLEPSDRREVGSSTLPRPIHPKDLPRAVACDFAGLFRVCGRRIDRRSEPRDRWSKRGGRCRREAPDSRQRRHSNGTPTLLRTDAVLGS
jgi:hypothetical protein